MAVEPSTPQGSNAPKPSRQSPKLYILRQEPTQPRRKPGWIARAMGLAPYRGALLSDRARIELNFAAGLLLLISLFEAVLWTFLFNAIYNRDVFYVGPRLAYAVLSAAFFAVAVFWFERQILTFDDQNASRASKLSLAMVVRLLYILGAAYATSRPFELMLFREPILERAHQEAVRAEVATRLLEVQEAEVAARSASGSGGSSGEKASVARALAETADAERDRADQLSDSAVSSEARVAVLGAQLQKARSELSQLSGEVAYSAKVLATARQRHSEATLAGKGGQIQELRLAEEQARNVHAATLRSEAAQEAEVGRLAGLLAAAQVRGHGLVEQEIAAREQLAEYEKQAAEERVRVAKHADRQRQRLRGWVASLRALHPSEEREDENWKFTRPRPDFLEQLRILNDLRAGRPPIWTQGTAETRKLLQDEYGFTDLICPDRGLASGAQGGGPRTLSGSPVEVNDLASDCQHLEAKRTVYRQLYLVGWLLALLIPSLMIAIKKWMLPEELRFYYSRRHQAEDGDPDALRATEVDDQVQARLREMRGLEQTREERNV